MKRKAGTPESNLVERAIRGDKGAFGLLYERHMDAIYRYVFFRVGSPADAEDLTEDVFVRAWEAIENFERGRKGSFMSWLYRIAHNLVIDHYRKRQPQSWSSEQLAFEESRLPTVEEAAHHNQDVMRLAQAINKLEDVEQQVIVLRFIEGLSHEDVSTIIGKSEGASRVIQHRALVNLRALLGA
jgi:RNA polymerase sigma-70 factor (ECF subfamily)